MEEIWKYIPGAPNYMASNFGKIRSIDRLIKPGRGSKNRLRKGTNLNPRYDRDGYTTVQLGGSHPKGLTRKVHRLIMLTFIGPSCLDVNHKNGIKDDNAIHNLEYVTKSENHIHARRVLKKLIGESHWNNKTTKKIISNMKIRRKDGTPVTEIANEFGYSVGYIYELLKK